MLFTLIFISIEKFANLKIKQNPASNLTAVSSDQEYYRNMFGFNKADLVKTPNEVIGNQIRWENNGESLTVTDFAVIYKNRNVKFEEITSSKHLQDSAVEHLRRLGIEDITINYEKNKFLTFENGHLEEVKTGEKGNVLEVVFDDTNEGFEKVKVLISGSGEIAEVTIIREPQHEEASDSAENL